MKTKHAFIAAHASGHAIRFMCRVLGVAHSWFHARRRATPKRTERAARRDRLGSEIREIFEQSKRCYGAPRIHAELKARGLRISKRSVVKLMRENGIRPPRRRRRAPITTDSRHSMESFFGSLKTELVHRTRFSTRREARAALFEYIEIFYNQRRRHSSIGYRTPAQARRDMTEPHRVWRRPFCLSHAAMSDCSSMA